MGPIIIVVVVLAFLFASIFSAVTEISQGGSIRYDERAFQDFANAQYERIFPQAGYEDNILLVVLTDQTHSQYYYIAWVGDHVADDVNLMFGNEYTELGDAMGKYISTTDYTYNLDTSLRQVILAMAENVQDLGLESNLSCEEQQFEPVCSLFNYTDIPMTENTVTTALQQFTQTSGVPVCVVVEDMDDVFERGISVETILWVAALVIGGIVLVVVLLKRGRRRQDPDEAYRRDDRD